MPRLDLRAARDRLGLTVEQLAEHLPFDLEELRRCETGEKIPRADQRLIRSTLWGIEAGRLGAIFVGLLVALPIAGTVIAAIAAADPAYLVYTVIFIAVAVVGGGSGGLAYGLLRGDAASGALRRYAAGIVAVWAYLAPEAVDRR